MIKLSVPVEQPESEDVLFLKSLFKHKKPRKVGRISEVGVLKPVQFRAIREKWGYSLDNLVGELC